MGVDGSGLEFGVDPSVFAAAAPSEPRSRNALALPESGPHERKVHLEMIWARGRGAAWSGPVLYLATEASKKQ